MASSIDNVKLGICQVLWYAGAADAEVDLGYTKGGVTVSVTTETYESTVDQFGNTPIAEQITGRRVEATCPLAETTLLNFGLLFPKAQENVAGDRIDVQTGVGENLITYAKKLILRPKYMGSATTEDMVIWKAATPGNMEFAYSLDSERIFNVTFKGYPDSSQNDILFTYGDSAADAAVWS